MDTGLADRIRAKGVEVVEVAGWKTRGYLGQSFRSLLALHHHTAGSGVGTVPSLTICVYGRPGLPGPLIPVLQSREPDGNDKAYVLAAGRCNHAGVGIWRGISGNSNAGGVEVEHTGTGPVAARRREITCRILAALLEGPGGSRDARNACQHFEFAQPPGRKIDFYSLAPVIPEDIRARVAYWIGRTAEEDGFMAALSSDQQKRMYDEIAGDPDTSRLGEVTTIVRRLEKRLDDVERAASTQQKAESMVVVAELRAALAPGGVLRDDVLALIREALAVATPDGPPAPDAG